MSYHIPAELYTPEQCRDLDHTAISSFGIPGFALMQRAGHAAWALLKRLMGADTSKITVLCGRGNNGGDGFVVAHLAALEGIDVQVLLVGYDGVDDLSGEAKQAFLAMLACGIQPERFTTSARLEGDWFVDALIGIGVSRDVQGEVGDVIALLNRVGRPVLALDVPSGICAETGRVCRVAVRAMATITFIGVKQGLLTHQAVDYVGELHFADLGLPDEVYDAVPVNVLAVTEAEISAAFSPRKPSAHKGDHGHVLIVGGDCGMGGAVIMAAQAALRAGAGLVTVATRADHIVPLLVRVPEVMAVAVDHPRQIAELMSKAQVLVIGPGLGQHAWGQGMLKGAIDACMQSSNPPARLVDADALNLLSHWYDEGYDFAVSNFLNRAVITPHPKEAARLLQQSVAQVQDNRFVAIERLHQQTGATVVLKGAGSLIYDGDLLRLCQFGNPGMAVAGMGDVLCGVIAAVMAQGVAAAQAAGVGVAVHAFAGDCAAQDVGQRGMMATDLIGYLPRLVNPS